MKNNAGCMGWGYLNILKRNNRDSERINPHLFGKYAEQIKPLINTFTIYSTIYMGKGESLHTLIVISSLLNRVGSSQEILEILGHYTSLA